MERSTLMAFGVLPFLAVPHYSTWLVALNGFVYHMWFRKYIWFCYYDIICNVILTCWYNLIYQNHIAYLLTTIAFVIFFVNKYVWWNNNILHVVGVQWLILSGLLMAVYDIDIRVT